MYVGEILLLHAHQAVLLRICHRFDIRMGDRVEFVEFELVIGADVDISAFVLGAVAVFRGREDGYAFPVVLFFVAFHAHLVAADDGFEAVVVAEALGDVGAELHAYAAFAGAASGFGLRVGPEHFHHEAGLAGLSLVMSV